MNKVEVDLKLLIDMAFGDPQDHTFDLKTLHTILILLARQMRLLGHKVDLRIGRSMYVGAGDAPGHSAVLFGDEVPEEGTNDKVTPGEQSETEDLDEVELILVHRDNTVGGRDNITFYTFRRELKLFSDFKSERSTPKKRKELNDRRTRSAPLLRSLSAFESGGRFKRGKRYGRDEVPETQRMKCESAKLEEEVGDYIIVYGVPLRGKAAKKADVHKSNVLDQVLRTLEDKNYMKRVSLGAIKTKEGDSIRIEKMTDKDVSLTIKEAVKKIIGSETQLQEKSMRSKQEDSDKDVVVIYEANAKYRNRKLEQIIVEDNDIRFTVTKFKKGADEMYYKQIREDNLDESDKKQTNDMMKLKYQFQGGGEGVELQEEGDDALCVNVREENWGKEKVLIVESRPCLKHGGEIKGLRSIGLVSLREFTQLEDIVKQLEARPGIKLPGDKKLWIGIVNGNASVNDTIEVTKLPDRLKKLEDNLSDTMMKLTELRSGITKKESFLRTSTEYPGNGLYSQWKVILAGDRDAEKHPVKAIALDQLEVARDAVLSDEAYKGALVELALEKPRKSEQDRYLSKTGEFNYVKIQTHPEESNKLLGLAGTEDTLTRKGVLSEEADVEKLLKLERMEGLKGAVLEIQPNLVSKDTLNATLQSLKKEVKSLSIKSLKKSRITINNINNVVIKRLKSKIALCEKTQDHLTQLRMAVNANKHVMKGYTDNMANQQKHQESNLHKVRDEAAKALELMKNFDVFVESSALLESKSANQRLSLEDIIYKQRQMENRFKILIREFNHFLWTLKTSVAEKVQREEVNKMFKEKVDASVLVERTTEKTLFDEVDKFDQDLDSIAQIFQELDEKWMEKLKGHRLSVSKNAKLEDLVNLRTDMNMYLTDLNCKVSELERTVGDPLGFNRQRKMNKHAICASCKEAAMMRLESKQGKENYALNKEEVQWARKQGFKTKSQCYQRWEARSDRLMSNWLPPTASKVHEKMNDPAGEDDKKCFTSKYGKHHHSFDDSTISNIPGVVDDPMTKIGGRGSRECRPPVREVVMSDANKVKIVKDADIQVITSNIADRHYRTESR